MVAENKPESKHMVDKIIQYESGLMTEDQTIQFYKHLEMY